jgi:hypothetical protein
MAQVIRGHSSALRIEEWFLLRKKNFFFEKIFFFQEANFQSFLTSRPFLGLSFKILVAQERLTNVSHWPRIGLKMAQVIRGYSSALRIEEWFLLRKKNFQSFLTSRPFLGLSLKILVAQDRLTNVSHWPRIGLKMAQVIRGQSSALRIEEWFLLRKKIFFSKKYFSSKRQIFKVS